MAVPTTTKEFRTPQSLQTPFKTTVFDWDPKRDSHLTVATHQVRDIAKGNAVVQGYLVVEEDFTSAGLATIQVQLGGDNLTGAVGKANLVAGDVVPFVLNNGTTTQSGATYAKAAADTLDIVVGTAALTAGKAKIFLVELEVGNLQVR
jgi:hypothetical protein